MDALGREAGLELGLDDRNEAHSLGGSLMNRGPLAQGVAGRAGTSPANPVGAFGWFWEAVAARRPLLTPWAC